MIWVFSKEVEAQGMQEHRVLWLRYYFFSPMQPGRTYYWLSALMYPFYYYNRRKDQLLTS